MGAGVSEKYTMLTKISKSGKIDYIIVRLLYNAKYQDQNQNGSKDTQK